MKQASNVNDRSLSNSSISTKFSTMSTFVDEKEEIQKFYEKLLKTPQKKRFICHLIFIQFQIIIFQYQNLKILK